MTTPPPRTGPNFGGCALCLGLACGAFLFSALLFWLGLTGAPANAKGSGTSTTQRIVAQMPDSAKQWILVIFGGIAALVGLFFIVGAFGMMFRRGDRRAAS